MTRHRGSETCDDGSMSEPGPVQVYASADAVDVQLMRGRLETEGISCMVKGEPEGPYRVGPAYLWVPAEDEASARAIIDAVRSGAYELDGSEEFTQDQTQDPAPR
jgi:hypothetical protein